MNKLRTLIQFLFIAFLSLPFSGCGDDYLFEEESVSVVKQFIYALPERYVGEPYNFGQPYPRAYLDTGEVVKFYAAYSIDNKFIVSDLNDLYIKGKSWDIDGEYFNLNTFRYSFSTIGKHRVILQSTDMFNDVITDTLEVFVNTPISISISSPANGYNLVDPQSPEGIDLNWKVDGTDEWETSTCHLFASTNKKDVWDSPLATGSCKDGAHIMGPIFPDIAADSSIDIYWAIAAVNRSEYDFVERDSTPIYKFSTKFTEFDSAEIRIPIIYNDSWYIDSVKTRITIVSATKDTLGVYYNYSKSTTFKIRIKPQSGLRVYLEEVQRTDYTRIINGRLSSTQDNPIIMDLSSTAPYYTDTINFIDNVPPTVIPSQNVFSVDEPMVFYIFDNGSDINGNWVTTILNNDTLTSYYKDSKLTFQPDCQKTCDLQILAKDNYRNTSSNVRWKLEVQKDSVYISGPFPNGGS